MFQECQLDDSGTESDDETEKDDVDDVESEDGDISKSIPQNISHLISIVFVHVWLTGTLIMYFDCVPCFCDLTALGANFHYTTIQY